MVSETNDTELHGSEFRTFLQRAISYKGLPKLENLNYASGIIASASSRIDWNSTDDRYRSPKLGRTTCTKKTNNYMA
jgi:hypothetical protein